MENSTKCGTCFLLEKPPVLTEHTCSVGYRCNSFLALGFFIFVSGIAEAIPANRQTTSQGNTGVSGGALNRTAIFTNVKNPPYKVAGNDSANDTVAIQDGTNPHRAATTPTPTATATPIPTPAPTPLTLLRKNPSNPRYFQNAAGKPVYLTGAHAFSTLQDISTRSFDYADYFQAMKNTATNFLRMWNFEGLPKIDVTEQEEHGVVTPLPFARTGPGNAADGGLKFNLGVLNQAYFDRLRSRVIEAGSHGIYVSIMLFEGVWVNGPSSADWQYSLHNPANNVNGLSMGRTDIYTMKNSGWVELMEDYVEKVIQTVGDLDNVLYEIMNEGPSASQSFQYHMIDHIHTYEAGRPKQHMVGMTSYDATGTSDASIRTALLNSNADWISLAKREGNRTLVADAPATKVSINDSDHVWGWPISGNGFPGKSNNTWFVWDSLVHGHNPIYLDDKMSATLVAEQSVRNALDYARRLANRIDLNDMIPDSSISSTGRALVEPNTDYVIYQPSTASFTVNLPAQRFTYEWINPATGSITSTGTITVTAGNKAFTPPSDYNSSYGAVLHLVSAGGGPTPTPNPPPTATPQSNEILSDQTTSRTTLIKCRAFGVRP